MAGAFGYVTGISIANSGAFLMARIRGRDGALITRASLTTIGYTVRDLTAGTTAASVALTINDVVFNDLQLDNRWTKDATGYNFRMELPEAAIDKFDVDSTSPFKVTPRTFQVDVRFTPTTGEPFVIPYRTTPVPTWN